MHNLGLLCLFFRIPGVMDDGIRIVFLVDRVVALVR